MGHISLKKVIVCFENMRHLCTMKKGLDTKLGFRSIWAQEFRNLLVFIGCFQQWSE